MLRKILWKNTARFQIAGAVIGSLSGFILLLASLQFYFEMKNVMSSNEDLINPEFIIINKQVNLLNSLELRNSEFTEEEIKTIASQKFTEKVAGFISNDFALNAYTENTNFPDFYTDLFFEAVPDEFLDIKPDDWNWRLDPGTIPIILPKDYLNLYNFGFAPSQGLPRISPSMLHLVNFKISITGNGKQEIYRGKIVGFSNRINSILVPYDFLQSANKEFGHGNSKVSRLVIVSKNPTDPKISSFLDKNGYETIRENLKSSRLNIILKFIISFLGGLGFLIILLALIVFILSFQLIISKSADKIHKLSILGYSYIEISRPYILNLSVIIAGLAVSTIVILVFLKHLFLSFSGDWGLELTQGIHPAVLICGAGILIIVFLINVLAVIRQTKKFSH